MSGPNSVFLGSRNLERETAVGKTEGSHWTAEPSQRGADRASFRRSAGLVAVSVMAEAGGAPKQDSHELGLVSNLRLAERAL